MDFDFLIGMDKIEAADIKVNYRESIRAIIMKENNILMVYSNKGDYKFPGGGREQGETHEQTLMREVQEETGYIVNKVDYKMGVIVERDFDEFEAGSIFEMTSYYYLCEVTGEKTSQKLDDYEAKLAFCPVWINIDEAISKNELLLFNRKQDNNTWLIRESLALKEIKRITSET